MKKVYDYLYLVVCKTSHCKLSCTSAPQKHGRACLSHIPPSTQDVAVIPCVALKHHRYKVMLSGIRSYYGSNWNKNIYRSLANCRQSEQ